MKNKVLVKIIVPDIEQNYDLLIPLNKTIGNLIFLLSKSIKELSGDNTIDFSTACLYNSSTSLSYDPSKIVRETNIRNGSILLLM